MIRSSRNRYGASLAYGPAAIVVAAFVLAIAFGATSASAQTSLAGIRPFPGATADAAALATVKAERGGSDDMAGGRPGAPSDRLTKVYSTAAGVEEVLAFYINALNARPSGDSGPDEPGTVKRGSSSRPAWSADPYEEELQDSRSEATGEVSRPGAWVRKVLSARKPFDGQWIGTATLAWSATDKDGAVTMLRVVIQDRSFDQDGGKFSKTRNYAQKTFILLDSATWR
ncbi:MAG: hypothetical protein WCP29_18890 [Acidobacteriota bacterium]